MSKKTGLWYVINWENQTSFNAKTERGERFLNLAEARKRASHLADMEPGFSFFIVEAVEIAMADVSKAKIERLVDRLSRRKG